MQTNSAKITVKISPFTCNENGSALEDNGHFNITRLHLYEELGGEIARGEFSVFHDGKQESLNNITELKNGIIYIVDEKENGNSYKIPFFIVSRSFIENWISFSILCIKDDKFINNNNSIQHQTGIEETIKSLYSGNKDIRTKPTPSIENLVLTQFNETDYSFCERLCKSYKKNTIFAFGWEGLMIKDLTGGYNSFGNTEYTSINDKTITINGNGTFIGNDPQVLDYNKRLNHYTINPWTCGDDEEESQTNGTDYGKVEPKYCTTNTGYDNYRIIGKNYSDMIENMENNERLINSDLFSTIKLVGQDAPHFKIGDLIYYTKSERKSDYPTKFYIVKSNEIFWTSDESEGVTDENGLTFSWTVILIGVQQGTWGVSNEIAQQKEKWNSLSNSEKDAYITYMNSHTSFTLTRSGLDDYFNNL